MPFLELKEVTKGFGANGSRTEVLRNINLQIEEGEFVAIVGYSGAGKTTLINMISGLASPDSGQVSLGGKPITGPAKDRGIVFQNYSLLPWLTVSENILLAVDQVFPDWPPEKKSHHVASHVAKVNLSHARDKRPAELSGGMRQRVSVARALAMDPQVLLLDEPLSALDALTRATLQDEISRIWQDNRKTVVLITNDPDEGIYLADRIIPLSAGPGATLGPSIPVDLHRPRDRKTLNQLTRFKEIRSQVIDYLLASAPKRTEVQKTLILPDIEPEDLSIPKPLMGGRKQPIRRGDIRRESVEI